MNFFVIERDGDYWGLRRFGRQDVMISGPTVESTKEQAFGLVRQWAPCHIRVMGEVVEEWQLADPGGEWEMEE